MTGDLTSYACIRSSHSTNGSEVSMWTDGEGGNLQIQSTDTYNNNYVQMDLYDGNMRCYMYNGSTASIPGSFGLTSDGIFFAEMFKATDYYFSIIKRTISFSGGYGSYTGDISSDIPAGSSNCSIAFYSISGYIWGVTGAVIDGALSTWSCALRLIDLTTGAFATDDAQIIVNFFLLAS